MRERAAQISKFQVSSPFSLSPLHPNWPYLPFFSCLIMPKSKKKKASADFTVSSTTEQGFVAAIRSSKQS